MFIDEIIRPITTKNTYILYVDKNKDHARKSFKPIKMGMKNTS